MQKVRIKSGEYEFVGVLLEDEAPKTCEVFKSMLPIKSQFIHVRWSGEGIWIPYGDLRTGLDYENHISHPAIGEMLFYLLSRRNQRDGDYFVLWEVLFCQSIRAVGGQSFSDYNGRD